MYQSSSLPRPGSSRIPPPTPSTKVLFEMQPPNSRLTSNNTSTHNSNTHNNAYNGLSYNASNNNNNSIKMNNDAAMMPPPSQAITASLKQKPLSRSPTSSPSTSFCSSSRSSSRDNSVSPSSIPLYYKRELPWNVTKYLVVSGNSVQKRITLVDRAGPPPASKVSSGAQARNAIHGRSASSQIGRSNSTGLSKSVGSRPNSSLGLVRGVPTPAPRPTSAQGERQERQENGGPGLDPTAAMPRRKGKHRISSSFTSRFQCVDGNNFLAWDLKGRLEDTESAIEMMKSMMAQERTESSNIKEQLEDHKLKGVVDLHPNRLTSYYSLTQVYSIPTPDNESNPRNQKHSDPI